MRGGTRAYSYLMHVSFTQVYQNATYAESGDAKYPSESKVCPLKENNTGCPLIVSALDDVSISIFAYLHHFVEQ